MIAILLLPRRGGDGFEFFCLYFSLKALIASSECCFGSNSSTSTGSGRCWEMRASMTTVYLLCWVYSFCNNCIDVFIRSTKSNSSLSFSDFRIVSIRSHNQQSVCLYLRICPDEGIFTIWEDNVDNWKVVLNVCDNVWVAHVECTSPMMFHTLALWIVFLSSDTTRKGQYPLLQRVEMYAMFLGVMWRWWVDVWVVSPTSIE